MCETQFAEDLLGRGVVGLSAGDVRRYLEYCADQRLTTLGLPKLYGTRNPLTFMDLQDVQEVANFFERHCRPIRSASSATWCSTPRSEATEAGVASRRPFRWGSRSTACR